MEFRIVHIDSGYTYRSLKEAGGEKNMYQRNVKKDFSGFEQFYDERQSTILKSSPGLFDAKDRSFQLALMRNRFGMLPHHKYLDYGCATLAAGRHIIEYLEAGGYTGMDVSEEAIRLAQDRIKNPPLREKNPRLFHIKDGVFPELESSYFDYAVAFSVFTHCPPKLVLNIMKYIYRLLAPGGLFVASISVAEKDILMQGYHNFYYPKEFFYFVAGKMNIDLSIVEDETSLDARAKNPQLIGDPMNVLIRKPA
ncbi:MAG: class I SAM-dependent methyltransferase [Nisaea sp.]|jgi:SAM-dependent methyltransferase|uniref:class I SAM-dependent methyltransferase n=1 Tax=Nisaea sp. TaxID=2024842 RepID=UPI001B0A5FD7|nr:class I SAM-dependent methyltransferase [Nisaea sp.]MBO6561172.1 class I SAM-dependent methyltransferase [Nisaea sp.]